MKNIQHIITLGHNNQDITITVIFYEWVPYSQQYFVVGLYNSVGLVLLITITIRVRRISVVVVVGLRCQSCCVQYIAVSLVLLQY